MVTTKRTTRTASAAPKLPEQIKPLNSGESRFTRMLIYGDPGTGKTPFAASAPNALILEVDRGLESAIAAGSTAKKWKLDDWNDATEALEYVRNGGHKDFEWIIVDSGTMLQQRGLDNIMEDLHASRPHRQVWAPDKGEYGQNQERLKRWMRDMAGQPCNLIITAHAHVADRELADGTIITSMMPGFTGRNVSQTICGYVAIVGHMQTVQPKKGDGDEYAVLSTKRKDGWYGKDRFGAIGRLARPTVPKVIALIEGKLDPTTTSKTGV